MTETIFRRNRAMTDAETMKAEGQISMLASTDDAVDWGGWREVLSHATGACDTTSARSLLLNHDPQWIAGGISAMQCDGRSLMSDASIDEDARMQSGVSVRKMVAKGRLNGVSIGYTYKQADTTWNEETRTLNVSKWRLLEISLTPIPADARAHVRLLPFEIADKKVPASQPAAPAAATNERSAMPDNANAAGSNAATNGDEATRAAEITKLRREATEAKLRSLAFEHGVPEAGSIDYAAYQDEASGLKDLLKRKAVKEKTPDPVAGVARTRVVSDALDKHRDAVTGAFALKAGFRNPKMQDGNHMLGFGIQDMIREYAEETGNNTRGWSRKDIAYFALGRYDMMSRNANVTSSNFTSFVMLNAVTKITAMGFERGYANARYKDIVSTQSVPDFKSFTVGALGVGNLSETVEDAPLPELSKAEAAYSNTAKTWGGTISLTVQALQNDDTGAFTRALSQAGALLDKTMDRRAFQKLLMGTSPSTGTSTWTSNTTSGGSLVYTTVDLMAAARGKLGLVSTGLQIKLGLDGNPTGNQPRFLIVGPTNSMYAKGITGASGPGLAAGAQQSDSALTVVVSSWLEASALTGYSTTSYYLLADPGTTTGLILSTVSGYEGINVETYDPGSVLAMKWKLWSPFEVDLFYGNNSAGTATVPAAQQGTT